LAAWRVEFGEAPALGSDGYTHLLDRAFRLTRAGAVDEAALDALIAKDNLAPLRLTLDAEGRTLLYCEPKVRDDRGSRQLEVDRYVLTPSERGLRLAPPVSEIMFASAPDQTVLREWEAAAGFAVKGEPKITLRRKQALIEEIESRLAERRQVMAGPFNERDAKAVTDAYRAARATARNKNRSRRVPDLVCTLPLGLIETDKAVRVLVLVASAESALLRNLPSDQAAVVEETFVSQFRDKDYARGECKDMRKETAFNPSIEAVPAADYRLGRPLFEVRDWGGATVYWPLVTKGRKGWMGDGWRYSHQVADLTTLAKALTPTRYDDKTIMGEAGDAIIGVWLHPAIDLSRTDPFVSFLIAGGGVVTAARRKIDR
jgi:hypothetical protein